jgi:hypothetical protein
MFFSFYIRLNIYNISSDLSVIVVVQDIHAFLLAGNAFRSIEQPCDEAERI